MRWTLAKAGLVLFTASALGQTQPSVAQQPASATANVTSKTAAPSHAYVASGVISYEDVMTVSSGVITYEDTPPKPAPPPMLHAVPVAPPSPVSVAPATPKPVSASLPAPRLAAPARRSDPSCVRLQERIEALCGRAVRNVEVHAPAKNRLEITLQCASRESAERIAKRIVEMPELGPYEVALDLKLVP